MRFGKTGGGDGIDETTGGGVGEGGGGEGCLGGFVDEFFGVFHGQRGDGEIRLVGDWGWALLFFVGDIFANGSGE